MREFQQIDVFTTEPFRGNPVAVVLDAEGLSDAEMQRFAAWTNLSETTFVLPPTLPGADYRVRIFTPGEELPFAGHPTLGTCHAWLRGQDRDEVVQECGAGLITLRRQENGLAFAAPRLIRTGAVDDELREQVAGALGISGTEIVDAQWCDNGPGWVGVLLADADAVLALRPAYAEDIKIGVAGAHPAGGPADFEVRAFAPLGGGSCTEDPVTGSFNASLAQWLLSSGRARAPYTVRQGTVLGRDGRVRISTDDDGTVWVGGGTVSCITGQVAG
jgi:PhzF family phenazine biosynthesis protein